MAEIYMNGDAHIPEITGSKAEPNTVDADELIPNSDTCNDEGNLNALKKVNTNIENVETIEAPNIEENVETDLSSDSGILNGSYDINDSNETFHSVEEEQEAVACANAAIETLENSSLPLLKDNILEKIDCEIQSEMKLDTSSELNVINAHTNDNSEDICENDINVKTEKTNENVETVLSEVTMTVNEEDSVCSSEVASTEECSSEVASTEECSSEVASIEECISEVASIVECSSEVASTVECNSEAASAVNTAILNCHDNVTVSLATEENDVNLSESCVKSVDDISLTESYIKISLGDSDKSDDDIPEVTTDICTVTADTCSDTVINKDVPVDNTPDKISNDSNKDIASEITDNITIDIPIVHETVHVDNVAKETSEVEVTKDIDVSIVPKIEVPEEPIIARVNVLGLEAIPNKKTEEIPVIDLTNSEDIEVIVLSDNEDTENASTTSIPEVCADSKETIHDSASVPADIIADVKSEIDNDRSVTVESVSEKSAVVEIIAEKSTAVETIDVKPSTVKEDKPADVEIIPDSKSITDDSKVTPIEIIDDVKSTSVVTDDSKSVPVEINVVADDSKSVPVEIKVVTDDSKSVPVENNVVTDDSKPAPVEINVEIIDDTKSVPVESIEKSELISTAVETVDDSIYMPVGTLEESTPTMADTVKEPKPEAPSDKPESVEDPEPEDEELDILGNGLLKKMVILKGNGKTTRPLPGNLVTVRCEGRLANGTVVDKHEKLQFILSDEDVIQAFDLAVALMDDKEVASVFTDARYAYGIHGRPDFTPPIPQNASLTYEIEILSIAEGPTLENMSSEERIMYGDKKRMRGNDLYGKEEYSASINAYKRGIKYLEGTDDEDVMNMKVKCLNNLSAAQLKVKAYKMAIQSLDTVLQFEPDNVKALFRKGKCLEGLKKEEEALEYIKKASMLDPTNKSIVQELGRLRSRVAVTHQKEKQIYQKMFQPKKEEKLSKEEEDLNWSVKLTSVVVGVLGIIAGLLWYKHR